MIAALLPPLSLDRRWTEFDRDPQVHRFADHEGGWAVEYVYEERDGDLSLVGLRIARVDQEPDELSSAVLRERIRIREHRMQAREELKEHLDDLKAASLDREKLERRGSGGRPRHWTDERLAREIAKPYAELVAAEVRNVNAQLSAQTELSPEMVRDRVSQCRDRGILTRTVKGRAGGRLTRYGRELVEGRDRGRCVHWSVTNHASEPERVRPSQVPDHASRSVRPSEQGGNA